MINKYSRNPDQFAGIITDNAAAMKAASTCLLQEYPALIVTTCFARSKNLLVDDILKLPSVAEVLEDVTLITSTVRNSSIINAHFSKICEAKNIRVSLVVPCITRWSSNCRSMKNIITQQLCLKLLAIECEELKSVDNKRAKNNQKTMTSIILNDQFWKKLQKSLDLIKPFVDLIMTIQTDEPNIHTIYPFFFFKIQDLFVDNVFADPLSPDKRSLILYKFQLRKEQFMKPLYWVAYLLDSNSYKTLLHPDQHIDAIEFINDFCEKLGMSDTEIGEVLADLIHFKNKTSIFSKTFLWKIKDKVHPIQWWENMPLKLSTIAIRILSVPAISASTEQSFSQMQDVQKKKWNRLTFNRDGKLTFIALNNQLLFSSSPAKIMSNKRKSALIPSQSGSFSPASATIASALEEEKSAESEIDKPDDFSLHDTHTSDSEDECSASDLEFEDIMNIV